MNINKIFQSAKYGAILKLLGLLLIAIIIFAFGVLVGHKNSEFSRNWNNNYKNNFGGLHSPFQMMSDGDDSVTTPHGTFGTVIGVSLPTFAVKGPGQSEKVITIGSNTIIRNLRNVATTTDLHVGDSVVIIGEPNTEGKIEASFIRIVPTQASSTPNVNFKQNRL